MWSTDLSRQGQHASLWCMLLALSKPIWAHKCDEPELFTAPELTDLYRDPSMLENSEPTHARAKVKLRGRASHRCEHNAPAVCTHGGCTATNQRFFLHNRRCPLCNGFTRARAE